MSNSDPKSTQEDKVSTYKPEEKLQTGSVEDKLQTVCFEEKLQADSFKKELQTDSIKKELQTDSIKKELQTESAKETIYIPENNTLIASALERIWTVILTRLSEDEIGKYMQMSFSRDVSERPCRKEKTIAKYNLKDRSRIDFAMFEDYKKTRKNFLKRKKASKGHRKKDKNSSPKKCEFHESHLHSKKNETHDEDGPSFLGMPLEQSPNTSPSHSFEELSPHKIFPRSKIGEKYKTKFRLKKAKKRKTPILDSDSDFEDFSMSPSNKKNNSSRNFGSDQMIMSGSSSATSKESQEFYNKFKHKYPHLDAAYSKLEDSDLSIISKGVLSDAAKHKLLKNVDGFQENQFDVVSQIIGQMNSSNMRKTGNIDISNSASHKSKSQQPWKGNVKKKASHLVLNQKFVRSSDGGNSKNAVLQTMNNLINRVCQDELEPESSSKTLPDNKLLNNSENERRCKWCTSVFSVRGSDDDVFCVICNEKKGKIYAKSYRSKCKKEKKKQKKQNAQKCNKINMMGQVLKKLPESEKNRLLYKGNDSKQESDKKDQSSNAKKQDVKYVNKPDNERIKLIINKVRSKIHNERGDEEKIFEISKVKKKSKKDVKRKKSLCESKIQKPTKSSPDPNISSKDKEENNNEESSINAVQVKETGKGLFLFTLTKSDEELDLDSVSPTKSINEYTNRNLLTVKPTNNISSLPVENNLGTNVQNNIDSRDKQNSTSSVLLIPKNSNINVNTVIFTQNSNVPTLPTGTFDSNTLQTFNNPNASFMQRNPILQQTVSVVQQNSPLLLQNQVIVQQNRPVQPNQTASNQNQQDVFQNQPTFVQYQPQFIQNQPRFVQNQPQFVQNRTRLIQNQQRLIQNLRFVQNQNPMLASMLEYQPPIQQSQQPESVQQDTINMQQNQLPMLENSIHVQQNSTPMQQNSTLMQQNSLHMQQDPSASSLFESENCETDVTSVARKIKQEIFTEHEQQKLLNQSHDSPNVSQECTTGVNENVNNEPSKSDVTNNNVQVPAEISEIVKTAMMELEAISIIAVLDLEDNVVQNFANIYDKEVIEFNKLKNENLPEDIKNSETLHLKIRAHMSRIQLFTIVQKLIQQHGSFTKLAESILGTSSDNSSAIRSSDNEEVPHLKTSVIVAPSSSNPKLEQRRQSCQFAEPVDSEQDLPSPMSDVPVSPLVNVKLEKMNSGTDSCSSNKLATGTNPSHIEKLESQISSMSAPLYPSLAEMHTSSAVPSFPAPIPVFEPFPNEAPSAVAPRNELINEARQTPSTGSGSRTPSRPESARSHVDTMSAADIKKEKVESANAITNCKQEKAAESRSACSYFQTPETTQENSITDNILQGATSIRNLLESSPQVSGIAERQNMQTILEPTNQIQPSIESTNFQVYQQSTQGYGVQSPQQMQGTPVMHNMQNNQAIPQSSSQQMPHPTQNSNLQQLQALLSSSNLQRQPVSQRQNNAYPNPNAYYPSTRQPYLVTKDIPPPNRTVPFNGRSFNVDQRSYQQPSNLNSTPNRYVIRNAQGQQINVQQVVIPNNHRAGTVMQQNPVLFSQNGYSSNNYVLQQPQNSSAVYTSGMNTQNSSVQNVYTASSAGSQVNQQLNSVASPAPPPYVLQNQPHPVQTDTSEIMYCAECMKLATLRCKQCAKVAYCNTNCAKIYWHRRHKIECKTMAACTM